MASSDGTIRIDTEIDGSGAERDLGGLQKSLAGASKKMQSTGKTMTKGLTTPILGAGVASAKFAIDQENAFAKVSTLLTGSAGDYEKYKADIRKNSSEMGVAFDEYSEAVYGSISAGVSQGEAVEFAGGMAKLAKGGFTDMATATDVVTTAINAYGLETKDAGRISDMLINTQNLGKTTVDELASSMGAVIPTAQAQGVSMEQLSTGYAILTKNGIATSEAGTYMKAMFGELGKSGSKTDKILREKTGKSFKELTEEGKNTAEILGILEGEAKASGLSMSDLFGSAEAGNAALTIMKDGGDDFSGTLESMGDVAGTTGEAFDKMNETTGAKMQKAWVQLQNSAAELGDILVPIIAKIVEKVTEWIQKFAGLSPAMKKTIVIVAGIVAAIGPLLIGLGMVVGAIAKIMPAAKKAWSILKKLKTIFTVLRTAFLFLTGPVGIVIGIITLLAILIYKNWDLVKEKTAAVFGWIGEFLPIIWAAIKAGVAIFFEFLKTIFFAGLQFIANLFSTIWGGLVAIVSAIWSGIVAAVTWFINLVVTIVTTIFNALVATVQFIWNGLVFIFTAIWSAIVAAVTFYINLVVTIVTTIFNAIVTTAQFIWNGLLAIINFVWSAIVTAVTFYINMVLTIVTTIFNFVKTVITTAVNFIKNAISTGFNFIKNTISTVLNFIKNIITSIWTGIRNFVSSTLSALQATFSRIWNAIKTTVTTISTAIYNAIMNAFNKARNFVSNTLEKIKSTVSNAFNKILSIVTGLGTKFYNAGKGLIEQIIKGIKAMIGKVTDEMSALATKMRDFLPFSPAKTGPLSDLDQLDFGGPVGDSIKSAIPKVKAKMQHLLKMPKIGKPETGGAAALASVGAGAAGVQEGDTVNNFTVNTQPGQDVNIRQLSQELYKLQKRDQKGAGRK